jgi:hypothetical protein
VQTLEAAYRQLSALNPNGDGLTVREFEAAYRIVADNPDTHRGLLSAVKRPTSEELAALMKQMDPYSPSAILKDALARFILLNDAASISQGLFLTAPSGPAGAQGAGAGGPAVAGGVTPAAAMMMGGAAAAMMMGGGVGAAPVTPSRGGIGLSGSGGSGGSGAAIPISMPSMLNPMMGGMIGGAALGPQLSIAGPRLGGSAVAMPRLLSVRPTAIGKK